MNAPSSTKNAPPPADASVAGEEDPGAALDTLVKPAGAAPSGGGGGGRESSTPAGPQTRPAPPSSPSGNAPSEPGDRDPDAPGGLSKDAPP